MAVARGQGLILKPISPVYVRDDAFVAKIDLKTGTPFTKPWVKFIDGFWENKPSEDGIPCIKECRDAEIRLFVVKEGASFAEISREMNNLIKLGFRPTTLRHLVAFCNTDNAKNLNTNIAFITSTRPVVNVDGRGNVRLRAFYSAITKKDEIDVGILLEDNFPDIRDKVVLLEAPPER